MKLQYKIYIIFFCSLCLTFAQTFEREGNLIKLDDGRVIEVNEQTLEDYFFFEIDNPRISDSENKFSSGFDAQENNSYKQSPNSQNVNSVSQPNQNNTSPHTAPNNYTYSQNQSPPFRATVDNQSFRSAPTSSSLRGSRDSFSLREAPNNQSFRSAPTSSSLRGSRDSFSLREAPNNQSFRSAPTSSSLRGSRDSFSLREAPINQTLKTAPINISIHGRPQTYYPSPTPVNQSLRTPVNSSQRGNFGSKSRRDSVDNESIESSDSAPNQISTGSDTQAFDINAPQNRQNSTPQLSPQISTTERNQDFNLQDSAPNSRLNTQGRNEQASGDISNVNNNNINLNLYNLTNLLDQIFSKDKSNIKKKKKKEVRTEVWKNAYKDIINQKALELVKKKSDNSGVNEKNFQDFIIKLPLLYELIYSNKLSQQRSDTETQSPSIKEDDNYYKKSLELLTSILKSFPEINNNTVNVIIVTNTTPISSQREKNIGVRKGNNYYSDIDPRYQREFENIRRKYNYKIGLELAQIKKFFEQKKYSLVLKKLHKLEEIEPYNTRVKNIIGSAYYKIGFYEFAERYWQESLYIDPNQPLVEAYLDRITQYGDSNEGDLEGTVGDPF